MSELSKQTVTLESKNRGENSSANFYWVENKH